MTFPFFNAERIILFKVFTTIWNPNEYLTEFFQPFLQWTVNCSHSCYFYFYLWFLNNIYKLCVRLRNSFISSMYMTCIRNKISISCEHNGTQEDKPFIYFIIIQFSCLQLRFMLKALIISFDCQATILWLSECL